jgi:hypothetical protein
MPDYTPEGVKAHQMDMAVRELHSINKKLKKINRNIRLLTLLSVAITIFKYKDKIKEFNPMKGE